MFPLEQLMLQVASASVDHAQLCALTALQEQLGTFGTYYWYVRTEVGSSDKMWPDVKIF